MTWLTYTTLLASGMALALSIGACVVAIRSWLQSRLTLSSTLYAELTEVKSTVEALTLNLARLRSRVTMMKNRESTPESTRPIEPVDEAAAAADTRAQLNDALARGTIKGIG